MTYKDACLVIQIYKWELFNKTIYKEAIVYNSDLFTDTKQTGTVSKLGNNANFCNTKMGSTIKISVSKQFRLCILTYNIKHTIHIINKQE